MLCRYEFQLTAVCPVDESADHYAVTVSSSREIRVERLLEFALTFRQAAATQEVITARLAAEFPSATVETVGYHSNVRTTVSAGPSNE